MPRKAASSSATPGAARASSSPSAVSSSPNRAAPVDFSTEAICSRRAAETGELETAEGDELALAAPGVAELLAAFRGIKDAAQRDALLTVAKGLRG